MKVFHEKPESQELQTQPCERPFAYDVDVHWIWSDKRTMVCGGIDDSWTYLVSTSVS